MLSVALVLAVAACGSCMEMRETVERMVMVRTTGSDLQPAATGYMYKKENDGKESVIEMGESEVMEHLAKLYEQPKAFAAPIPIAKGLINNKEDDENKSESQSEERIIPVKEKQEDHIDGIADDDYKKMFDEYLSHYGDSKAYDDYVRSLGHFGDGLYAGYKGDNKDDDDGYEGYKKKHHYGNGKAGEYHNEKYESYAFSDKGHKEGQDGTKDYEKHYEHGKQNDGYGKKSDHEKDTHGFHKVFDNDDKQKQKDYSIYNNEDKVGFHKFSDEHKYHDADRGYEKDSSESGHEAAGKHYNNEGSGAEGNSSEDSSSNEKHEDYGSKGRQAGHSYGFEVKH